MKHALSSGTDKFLGQHKSQRRKARFGLGKLVSIMALLLFAGLSAAQQVDQTMAPNNAKAGIAKSLQDEIGAGRGNIMTPGSSLFLINRDPFRSIRRGRQLFQRKFSQAQGQGPNEGDDSGDINSDNA